MAERKLSTAGHSLYESLGLAKGASPEEIKKAYRLLALRNHPDKNPDDPTAADRIRQINYANGILSDPQKRQLYDAYGSLGLQMAEQIGEERMRMMSGPWFKACFIFCGIISGCYCCFCCCCCCKQCREKRPMEGDLHMEEQGGKDSTHRVNLYMGAWQTNSTRSLSKRRTSSVNKGGKVRHLVEQFCRVGLSSDSNIQFS